MDDSSPSPPSSPPPPSSPDAATTNGTHETKKRRPQAPPQQSSPDLAKGEAFLRAYPEGLFAQTFEHLDFLRKRAKQIEIYIEAIKITGPKEMGLAKTTTAVWQGERELCRVLRELVHLEGHIASIVNRI